MDKNIPQIVRHMQESRREGKKFLVYVSGIAEQIPGDTFISCAHGECAFSLKDGSLLLVADTAIVAMKVLP